MDRRLVIGRVGEEPLELVDRPRPAANAAGRDDLAARDLEHGLDRHQSSHETGRASGTPAAHEVLERVERHEETSAAPKAFEQVGELLVVRPALEPSLNRFGEQDDRTRDEARVDRSGARVGLRGDARALVGAREPGGDRQQEHAFVSVELRDRSREVARRRLGAARLFGGRAQPPVELDRLEVDVVAEELVAESDVERHDAPVRMALRRVREIGRRVQHDRRVVGSQVHEHGRKFGESNSLP